MARIFLTGATGYIGGQILHELASTSKHAITVLSRDAEKSRKVTNRFPQVNIVQPSLDDTQEVKKAASDADIILHLGQNKHIPSVKAIHEALSQRELSRTAYWIQVSGASVLAAAEIESASWVPGSPSNATFDDYDNVAQLRDLIRSHPTRAVDNYILDVAEKHPNIKTAILFPPVIYGEGQGPVNQRSIQVPTLAKVALERGSAVQVGKGQNRWGTVHVRDLGRLTTALVEAAASGEAKEGLWSQDGLYFTSSGETSFSEISQKISDAAKKQGLIKQEATVVELVRPECDQVLPAGSIMYGTNARGSAQRASKLLGWSPKEEALDDEIPRAVAAEASNRT